jgi:hypothetical protein
MTSPQFPHKIMDALPSDNELMMGVVTNVTPLAVSLRGASVSPGLLGSYSPAIGDNVAVLREESTLLALGAIRNLAAGATAYGGPMRPIRRGRRETNSTAAAAEQPVLRVDDISLTMGNLYFVHMPSANLAGNTAADRGNVMLRLSTAGIATVASTQIQASNTGALLASVAGSSITAGATFTSTVNSTTASVLLSTQRFVGAGTVFLQGGPTFPIELLIYDLGPDIGDTGVDL